MIKRSTSTLLALLLLGAAAFALLTLWNDFPYFYHTDEPGKVKQIAENTRNLHHPLLMLEWVALDVRLLGLAGPQAIVEAGRQASAFFAAAAVALLAWSVTRRRGLGLGVLAGVLLVLQPDVQEYARYFKEDPALLLGCAAVFAAMIAYEDQRTTWRAALLGLAVALAVSAKYVGIIMALPALLVLLRKAQRQGRHRAVWGGVLLMGVMIINLRLLLDLRTFIDSLGHETTLVMEGQGQSSKRIPHAGFFMRLFSRSWHLLPFCIAGGWTVWRERRRHGIAEACLALSPLALALLLSFSAKDSGRYFLPASLGIAASAAVGIGTLISWPAVQRYRTAVATAAVLLAVGLSLNRSWPYMKGFQSDARRELLTWVSANVQPGSHLLQGRKVCLPDSSGKYTDGWKLPVPAGIQIETTRLLPDVAPSLEALAAKGVTHVVMASDEFEPWLRDDAKAKKHVEQDFERRRQFYRRLEKEATLLWQRAPGKVGTHQPELRLYRLSASS